MQKPPRWITYFIIISFILTMIPLWPQPVQAADPVIANIYIERTDDEVLETASGVIEIDGQDLKDAVVRVRTTGGGGSKVLGTEIGTRVVNENTYIKFSLPGADMRSILWSDGLVIGGTTIPVDETNMAAITSVVPSVAFTVTDTITINGSNLNQDVLTFGNGNMNGTVNRTATAITISGITGDVGLHDVIFTRDILTHPGGITGKLTFRKLYQNQFRVVQELSIPGLEMYPNIGQPKKTTVYFQAPGLAEYSVFFLRNESDPFYAANMGTDYNHVSNVLPSNSLITVKVPDLTPGSYHVIFTNKMDDPPSGVDLRSSITQQMLVGDFTIVSSTNAAEVVTVSPATGPTMTATPLEIVAYNIEELNINSLTMDDAAYTLDLADANTMEIEHGTGHYQPGADNKKVEVTRTVKVTIGALATFQDVSKQSLVNNNYDTLSVNTGLVQDSDIVGSPTFDVILDIQTTLTVLDAFDQPTGETYVFTEQPVKEKAFTFIKSYDEPVATKVTPDKIQVDLTAGGYATKEEMYIGITGTNFVVSKYIDSATGEEVVHYPEVILGGFDTGAGTGPGLCFRREGKDPTVVLGWDQAHPGIEQLIPGAYYEVYNGTTVVTGASGNDTGNRILIKIPANLLVDKDAATTELILANPKKSSSEYGYRVKKSDLLQFVVLSTEKTPVINSITPNIVSTDGTKGVRIDGYNFQPNVKLYLEDTAITCKRDASGKIITFDAPAWKEGKTRILVMNSEGGADSAQLIYVQSQTKPTITKLTPPEGTINTMVTINGSVFLTPDPTAIPWDLGIYRLIGTRVFFGNRDINDYWYKSGSNEIDLKDYTAPAGQNILSASGSTATMADYYYSVLLQVIGQDKFYVLNYNNLGKIMLTDGTMEYEIYAASGALKARDQSGGNWDVAVTDSTVILSGSSTINLKLVTPYVFGADNVITGNRVKVTDHGTRIYAVVPDLLTPGLFDVTVVNPDTNSATLKGAFTFYRNPQRLPVVTSIVPDRGSVSGGYYIRINGENFEDNGTIKTRVFINSIEVAAADVKVGLDGTTLDVKVPAYPGDLKTDFGVDHKAVPVTILNPSDGGSIGLEDAFTYVLPSSNPVIDKISKTQGSAAGGDYIEITGRDFRFYEPYDDLNSNVQYDEGNDTYTDLNGDTIWNDLSAYDNTEDLAGIADYQKILPQVYFGSQLATIKNYGNGYLGVISPAGAAGTVDVYIVNNDYGVSNKKTFAFTSSKPGITSILPATGAKQGNELVEILGSGYVESSITVLSPAGTSSSKNTPLVRFGSIDNLSDEEAGTIVGGEMPSLELTGNLTVEFSANNKEIKFTLVYAGTEYTQTFTNYDGSACFFDLTGLLDSSGNPFPGCELIKAYTKDRRLIVERGYSPKVDMLNAGHLVVTTPSYYTVGQVVVKVMNPDGGVATGKFEYKNPGTNPSISNITRNGVDPETKTVDGENLRIVEVNYKGGSTISIIGDDFTAEATIQIGSLAQIASKDISYNLPTTLSFVMPAVSEAAVGTVVSVIVSNEDGGVARSDQPSSGLPIKILFTKGETAPEVSNLSPARGPAAGGTRVAIKGKDFRESMAPDYPGQLKVYFGAQEASVASVKYDEIIAISPAADPGAVEVKVENPDGETSTVGTFTYVSSPTISTVTLTTESGEEVEPDSISVKGGQQLNITGTDFLEGCRVVFIPVIEQAADASASGVIYYVTSKTSNGGTSSELDPYVLKSGTDGTEVTVVDANHITVKTPAGKLDATGIMVINPDLGASSIFEDITFGLPQLDVPTGVTAVLVRDEHYNTDRYIKVQWEAVTGAVGYEIEVVIGTRAYNIGSSKYTSLVYDDLEPNTAYKFVVKALGDFGSSQPSAESNWVYTGSTVGEPDRDGGLGEQTQITPRGSVAMVNIGSDGAVVNIDLTQGNLAACREVQVTIPAPVIYSSSQTIKISSKEYQLEFNPGVFRNDFLAGSSNESDAGIRFKVYPYSGSIGSAGGNNLSAIYCLEASSFIGQEVSELNRLSGSIKIKMRYDTAKAKLRRFTKMDICWYEPYSETWLPVNGSGSSLVEYMGKYSVIGRR